MSKEAANILKILTIVWVSILQSRCTDNNEIIISNLNQNLASPVEFGPQSFMTENALLKAQSIEDPNIEFFLQKSLSIFHSIDSSIEYSYSAVIDDRIIAGRYRLINHSEESPFLISDDSTGKLTVFENENPVLSYNFEMQLQENVPERYRRANYIHPVYDLNGNILTDDFPADHFHHRGISWMWPKIFVDSTRYDLWHIYGPQGEYDGIHQIFEDWIVRETGPVCTTIGAKTFWQVDDGRKVMDEWIYIKVYKATNNARAIDFKLIWKANSVIGIEGQTKKGYGGFNFRLAPRRDTQIYSNEGKEEDSDLKNLPWADQSAKFAENNYYSGVSIFQNKDNINFPAGWCLRHYGFLGVAWPGIDRYTMNPGEMLTLSFRVWIHKGDVVEGHVPEAYEIFSNPPRIEFN